VTYDKKRVTSLACDPCAKKSVGPVDFLAIARTWRTPAKTDFAVLWRKFWISSSDRKI
jgi:hypothetical protein